MNLTVPSLALAAVVATPLAGAQTQHLLVGGPDTLIRRALPVLDSFDIVGACGGIVESMAVDGDRTFIGDRTGVIYDHTPQTGVGYVFNAGNDARALATAGGSLFVAGTVAGGAGASVEQYDIATSSLSRVHRAPGAVRALVEVGGWLYAGESTGAISRLDLQQPAGFTAFADCGCALRALASDGTDLLVGTGDGSVLRLDAATKAVTQTIVVGAAVRSLAMHQHHLLAGTDAQSVVRVDPLDGSTLDVLDVGGEVAAIAVTDGQPPAWTYCYGHACPCGNDDPIGGCVNSTGRGARLDAAGSTSASADDLALFMNHAPSNTPAVLVMGPDIVWSYIGDGLLCTGGSGVRRFFPTDADGHGTLVMNEIGAFAQAHFDPASQIVPGTTWHFQVWYRDTAGPCGTGINTSNSAEVTFTP